jgi:hypothetical protein
MGLSFLSKKARGDEEVPTGSVSVVLPPLTQMAFVKSERFLISQID